YRLLHQPKDAIGALSTARAIHATPEIVVEMSQAYRDEGDRDGAAIALLQGLVVNPEASSLAGSLVKTYQDLFPGSCALAKAGEGYSINMECPLVHGQLCDASRKAA